MRARARCPIVVGTTGWDARRAEVEKFVDEVGGALLAAPNFSLGVAAFTMTVEAAAAAMRDAPGFDVHLIETHHAQKKDAPSGTALALARVAAAKLGRDVPITSVRTGSVPGIHELVFDAQFEQIRLVHTARDRRVFAEGALRAASWLVGRRGIFSLRDVLATTASDSHDHEEAQRVRHRARHALHAKAAPSTSGRFATSSSGRSPRGFTSWCRAAPPAKRPR